MTRNDYHPWLHRVAVLTAGLVLLPITVGALVTTLGAGMAFLDWPSSDGRNMFLYPWLRDVAAGRTDKAVEHGHRLAGALIGLVSIALVVVAHWTERRRWVVATAYAVLAAVIVQGLLGGARVIQNRNVLAMVHGGSAAVVFSLMGCFALVTGRSWSEADPKSPPPTSGALRPLALITPAVLFGQYLLGGCVRHLGSMLHEHLGFAVIASVLVVATVVVSLRVPSPWIRRSATALLAVLLLQLGLGAGAWVTRFGFASTGYVAVQHSLPQVLFRTGHAVVGMTLLMVSVVHALRVLRLEGPRRTELPAIAARPLAAAPSPGGYVG